MSVSGAGSLALALGSSVSPEAAALWLALAAGPAAPVTLLESAAASAAASTSVPSGLDAPSLELRSGPAPAASAAAAGACGQGLEPGRSRLLSSPRQQLAFVTLPGRVAVGRHFSLDLVVCPRPGRSLPLALKVDADMPAHRHGMNYRATVRDLGGGRYRADGLMLHMPGRWRLLFDLSADGRIERLSHELDLE